MQKNIYHTPLENGIRVLYILEGFYPTELNIDEILKIDHLIKYSDELKCPHNLIPYSSVKKLDLIINRKLISDGIKLLGKYNLIQLIIKDNGYFYSSSESAPSFIKNLKSDYYIKLKENILWAKSNHSEINMR